MEPACTFVRDITYHIRVCLPRPWTKNCLPDTTKIGFFSFYFYFRKRKQFALEYVWAILNQGRSVQITHEQSVLLYSLPSPWVKKKKTLVRAKINYLTQHLFLSSVFILSVLCNWALIFWFSISTIFFRRARFYAGLSSPKNYFQHSSTKHSLYFVVQTSDFD